MPEKIYTRFERARIIGARALQIARGAPLLTTTKATDPYKIAIEEFDKDLIPIDVREKKPPRLELDSS